jgi:ATP-dependent RNA helicase DDX19/DBP5
MFASLSRDNQTALNKSVKHDLIAQAHHGSGKTAAYSLSMLSRVDESKQYAQAMCVCPTRELVRQVADVCRELGKFTSLQVLAAIPGAARGKCTAQIVVGTPGTLLAKCRHRDLDTKQFVLFVLDEADQMISSQGHLGDTMKLKNQMPKQCQILLFSATFSDAIWKFAKKLAPNATEIRVKREELSLDPIKQYYLQARDLDHKYELLISMFSLLEIGQSIIFVHTVRTGKELANRMRKDNYTVSLLHGKKDTMSVEQRDSVMDDFRSGKTSVLITTNVLARGIDVLQVTLVVNYDVPLDRSNKPDPETYIHRIGRSGRFGRKGVAINFVHVSMI